MELRRVHFVSSKGCKLIIKALCGRSPRQKILIKGAKYLLRGLQKWERRDGLYDLLQFEIECTKELTVDGRRLQGVFGLNAEAFDASFVQWHDEFHDLHLLGMSALLGSRIAASKLLRLGQERSEWWAWKHVKDPNSGTYVREKVHFAQKEVYAVVNKYHNLLNIVGKESNAPNLQMHLPEIPLSKGLSDPVASQGLAGPDQKLRVARERLAIARNKVRKLQKEFHNVGPHEKIMNDE